MGKKLICTKKRNRRRFSAGLFAVLLLCMLTVAAISGCSSSSKDDSSIDSTGVSGSTDTPTDSDTLRVGVRNDISGFGYYNDIAEKFSGLEVDIAKELAARLGYSTVQYVVTTPETKEDMLINDEVDCVIACYSITESREEVIDFSPSYYTDASVIMIEQSSLFTNDIEDMKGATFGVREGTNTGEQLVERLKEQGLTDGKIISVDETNATTYYDCFQIREYPTYQTTSDALERGDVDAFCGDGCITRAYSEDDRKILDFEIEVQDYAVATKRDSVLSEPVYQTIQEMLDDGTIAELIDKWD